MGVHKNTWAIETIKQIKELGGSLGYITAEEEMRVTRGWVDISWRWRVPFLKDPLFLLIAEVETSKADWTRIRSNAAKAVELKPFIYAHIFHPSVRLTDDERSQLMAIHQGRHVLIFDGNSDFQDFLKQLAKFDQWYLKRELFAFCLLRTVDYIQVRESLSKIAGVPAIYELYGLYDFLVVLPFRDFYHLEQMTEELIKIKGVIESSTFLSARRLPIHGKET